MRKSAIITSALCAGMFVNINIMTAQEDTNGNGLQIAGTRPATPDGKLITMEQAVYSKDLVPENLIYFWKEGDGHNLLLKTDGKFSTVDPEGRKPDTETEYIAAEMPVKEEGCANITANPYNGDSQRAFAYTIKNNLYFCDKDGKTFAVTAYSEESHKVAGQTVSRNEFGITGGIFWSPDGSRIAFYVKDESKVSDFPLLDITTRTGSGINLKYPMAGMDSEIVSLGIYDTKSGNTTFINHIAIAEEAGWNRPEETYITNVCWSPDGNSIYAQLLDRSQKHSLLCKFDTTGNYVSTILSEDNTKYVEPLDPLYFIKGHNDLFIYRTANRDGYRSLYLADDKGIIARITDVDADVEYIGNDGRFVYYTSAEVSPVENHLFRKEVRGLADASTKKRSKASATVRFGKPQRLTQEEGWHNITISPDCKYFIDNYSSLNVPRVINLVKADGAIVRNLLTAKDPTEGYAFCEMTLGTVKSADGKYDNWYRLIKPKDFDPSKKYPLIVYVYGGPHSQMVRNTFLAELRRWEMLMAQKGYVVYVQDNRGTQNRGLEFEQAIHRQCGQAEMADQIEGVRMLMNLPYIDKERIGVHGWSYGGFMTISLITNYPEIFKVAVAGGPVIDWKWYEVMYGERYMDSPEANPEGYAKVSLINKAKDLKGKLLICQGAIDPVVVWQHSLSFVRECVVNNIQLDYFPYPRHEHNVTGRDRIHLMDKVTMYFKDYL